MRWTHFRKVITPLAVVLALTLSACGSAHASQTLTTANSGASAATATSSTVSLTSLPTIAAGAVPAACAAGAAGMSPQWQPVVQLGDLLVSQATASGLSGPSYRIPAGTPSKPLELAGPMANPGPDQTPVNPHLQREAGYVTEICNPSTHAVAVQSVWARITSFTAFSGPLAAWNPCTDGSYYAAQQNQFGGGCGGGLAANETMQASFPANAGVGATVKASQVSSYPTGPGQPSPFPQFPLSLAAGQSILVATGVTQPTAAGTYTFSLGLAVGDAAPVYFTTSAPALFAPVTQEWNGKNCTTAAMLAQIPTSSQSYYICPPA